jgi:hypothetical protein
MLPEVKEAKMMNQQFTRTWMQGALAAALLAVGGFAVPAASFPNLEQDKIVPADGGAEDEFGCAVDMDHGILAVGARGDDDDGLNSGSAYLYRVSNGSLIAKLLPSDGTAGSAFGFSIAIKDGIVAVGAPGQQHNGVVSGAAYLFDAATGVQLAKLVAGDASAGDEFGCSVALDAGVVAVGSMRDDDLGDACGSVYLFEISTGLQTHKLLPGHGGANQNFGVSMAMDGGRIAIGARAHFVLGEGFTMGRVYLFDVESGGSLNMLTANNGTTTDRFADSIDFDDGLVAVGAWGRSVFFDHSGAAYVFDASSGAQLAYIFPSDGQDRDHFGMSVSIDGGVLAVGADEDDDVAWSAGSAYLYNAANGAFIDKLLASDGAEFDLFGSSIAIDNGTVAVGAIGFGNSGFAGAAYLFATDCAADLNSDGLLNFFDVSMFLGLFSAEDAAADLTQDGLFDFFDVAAYLDAFSAGCD